MHLQVVWGIPALLTVLQVAYSGEVRNVRPRAVAACASVGSQLSSASQVYYAGVAV